MKCPKTGRDASACDSPDHRNCPDLVVTVPDMPGQPADHYEGPDPVWDEQLQRYVTDIPQEP